MHKRAGISRNRTAALKEAKLSHQRKKFRFQSLHEDEEKSMTATAITTSLSLPIIERGQHSEQYDRAKASLNEVSQIQSKIKVVTRSRLMTFKDSEIKRLDENINSLGESALNHISTAEKILRWIRSSKSENSVEEKFIRNMEKSLAFDIREATKGLRQQQKQFFDSIKNYETQGQNKAIQLSQQEKQQLKDEQELGEIYQQLEKERDEEINKLVTSINKLSSIYKQMNELVIDQGSLIDRIDYNLEESVQRVKRGVQHLVKAEEHQSSPFADRVIKMLAATILMLAMLLAYKYSK